MLKNFLKNKTPGLFRIFRTLYHTCKRVLLVFTRSAGYITRYFEKDPCVIMWIDGGFCSQIFRYIKGRWYAERGFTVKYDITWYNHNPKDCLGNEGRPFLLLESFPYIDFEAASSWELIKYRMFYSKSKRTAAKYKGHRGEIHFEDI